MKLEIDTETGMLSLDGVDIALDALWWIVHPDPSRCYRFERRGNQVLVYDCTLDFLKLDEAKDA